MINDYLPEEDEVTADEGTTNDDTSTDDSLAADDDLSEETAKENLEEDLGDLDGDKEE